MVAPREVGETLLPETDEDDRRAGAVDPLRRVDPQQGEGALDERPLEGARPPELEGPRRLRLLIEGEPDNREEREDGEAEDESAAPPRPSPSIRVRTTPEMPILPSNSSATSTAT